MNMLQRSEQIRARSPFQQIAGCTCGQRVENIIDVFISREHHKLSLLKHWLQLADALGRADTRKVEIDQHHRWFLPGKSG